MADGDSLYKEARQRIRKARAENATELDLSGLKLTKLPPDLASLTGLTTLDIGYNLIGDEGAKAIAASLTGLTSLDICNNSIGRKGAKAIAASLTGLTSLNIGSNSIRAEGAKAIAASLTALTTLYISDNSIGEEGAKAIAASLTGLTSLDIGNSSIGEEGTKAIAASLTGLTMLEIDYNSIGDEGAKAIAASLTGLTSLNIDYNSIGAEGTKAIAASLTGLTTLNIGGNSIGEEGAKAIAASLTGLTSLNVSGNSIGEEGAKAIAASLTGLTTLDIRLNSIGEEGAKAIAASLTGLTLLDIESNSIGEEGAKAIAASLTGLTTLNIGGNSIGEAAVAVDLIERLLPQADGGKPGGALGEICVGVNPLKTADGHDIEMSGLDKYSTQPASKVLDYLRAALQQGEQLLEARLVLVGVGGVGKSQLAGALAGTLELGEHAKPYTQGIEAVELPKLEVPGIKGTVRVRVFDCGGQPEQFSMHVLVWEPLRNAMALVCDATKPWGWVEGNRGDYFLRMIESVLARRRRDGDEKTPAPVLAVVTKADKIKKTAPAQTTPAIIMKAAGDRNVNLELIEEPVDALNQIGLEPVMKGIAKVIAKAPGLTAVVSAKFKPVRQAMVEVFGTYQNPKPEQQTMALAYYHTLAGEAGEDKPGQREAYLRIMHALGDLIYIPETDENRGTLRDVIINIHWARKAMYGLLTSPKVRERRGLLTWEEWLDIPEEYRSRRLVDLLKAQKVLYEITTRDRQTWADKTHWLLPDMLRTSDSPHPWTKQKAAQSVFFDIFLPESIFLRFLGEHREWISSRDAFRDEVLLRKEPGIEAVVRPDYESERHAIHFYANPARREESEDWCDHLYAKLTGELPPRREQSVRVGQSGAATGIPPLDENQSAFLRCIRDFNAMRPAQYPTTPAQAKRLGWGDSLTEKTRRSVRDLGLVREFKPDKGWMLTPLGWSAIHAGGP